MKAVKQIIDHLRGRGLLTRAQLLELASEGFLPWEEVVDDHEEAEPSESPVEATAPEEDETYDVKNPIRPKPVRKPRHAHSRGVIRGMPLTSSGETITLGQAKALISASARFFARHA